MPDERHGVLRQATSLFPRLRPEVISSLEGYGQVLKAVHPLKPRHAQELPVDIKDLSLALTAERGPGPAPNYLAHPASLSAYLYYFLPWNLYRLSRLFTGLDFNLPDGAAVLDVGAGPLTLAQALWIAKPELRARRLRFVCLDQTGSVLRMGRSLFEALSGEEGRNWTIELVQGPLHKAPLEPFTAVCALNSINELGKGRGEEGHMALDRLAEFMASRIAPGGRVLLVEPGTRQGGKLLARLRDILMEEAGLQTLGPCTHQESCPMLAPRWRSWCHFVFSTEDAPGWLVKLTKSAELEKDRVSLSYLDMAAGIREFSKNEARIVSSRFKLSQGQACYACAADGLHLLGLKRFLPEIVPGAWACIDWPERGGKDPKTGAWLTPLSDQEQTDAPVAVEKPVAVKKSRHPAWAKLPSQRPRKPATGETASSGKRQSEGEPKAAGKRAPGGKPGNGRSRDASGQRADEGARSTDGNRESAGERSRRGSGDNRSSDKGDASSRGRSDSREGGEGRGRATDNRRGEERGRGGSNRDGDGRERPTDNRGGEDRGRSEGNRRGEGRNRPAGNRRGESRGETPSGQSGPEGKRSSDGKRASGDQRDSGNRRGQDRGRDSGGRQGGGGARNEGGSSAPSGGRTSGGKPAPHEKRGSSGVPKSGGKSSPSAKRSKPGQSGKSGRSSGKPSAGGKPAPKRSGR